MKKRLISFVLILVMAVGFLSTFAFADTGDLCGDSLVWNFNGETGVLTIEGTGTMYDFGDAAPWESYKDDITSVIIGEGVGYIGSYAFYECTKLASVTIPSSVKSVGSNAFLYSENITAVYIDDLVNWCEISFYSSNSNPLACGASLYVNGEKVTDLVLPDDVTRVENYAFYNCDGIVSVTVPASVYAIYYNAFYGCDNIQKVIAADFNSWNDIAFSSNGNPLVNGADLYFGEQKVTDLVVPDGVETIRYGMFEGCTSITSVTLPDTIKEIENYAFYSCDNITAINVSSIEAWCNIDLYSESISLSAPLYVDGEQIKDLVIPDGVTSIGDYAFANKQTLESVSIPDSVKYIGHSAFYNCDSLTSISIPSSVETIDYEVFYDCDSLKTVTFAEGIKEIKAYAFAYCNLIETVNLPSGIEKIGDAVFYECESLKNVSVPDSVYSIGSGCFSDTAYYDDPDNWQDNLFYVGNHLAAANTYYLGESVTVREGTISIADSVFDWCGDIKTVSIPSSLKAIGYEAFYGCSSLEEIELPDHPMKIKEYAFNNTGIYSNEDNWENGVLYIGKHIVDTSDVSGDCVIKDGTLSISNYAFYYSENLESVTIPEGVTEIGEYVFSYCSELKSVSLPDGLEKIGYGAFSDCSVLEDISIPKTVAEIGEYAFSWCHNLKEMVIPDGVTEINPFSFNDSRIYMMYLPKGVTEIGDNAFTNTDISILSYGGSEEDRDNIVIGKENDNLDYVNWLYNMNGLPVPESISILADDFTGYVGGYCELSYEILPSIFSGAKCTWTSSDPEVVAVDGTYLNFISAGEATVTVTMDGGLSDSIIITVIDRPVAESVVISAGESISGYVDDSRYLDVELYPDGCKDESYTWHSSDESVAKMEGNWLYLLGVGTATVTVTTENGLTDSIAVEVKSVPSITLDSEANLFASDGEATLSFVPETDGYYVFTSEYIDRVDSYAYIFFENEQLAYDDDGGEENNFKVGHSMEAGKQYYLRIGYYGYDNSGNFKVTVRKAETATSFEILDCNTYVYVNDGMMIYTQFYPEDSAIEKITWQSSDESVVWVDDWGNVSFEGAGTATVTATTESGFTDSVTFNVSERPRAESVEIHLEKLTGYVNEEYYLEVNMYPEESVYENYTWHSSDESVAQMNGSNVVLVGLGTATITVTTENGLTDSMTVEVTTPDAITLDTEIKLNASDNGKIFSFVPETDGYYIFSSKYIDYVDSHAYILDENFNELYHSDDDEYSNNFKLGYTLEAGKQYYYRVGVYGYDDPGNFKVKLVKAVPATGFVIQGSDSRIGCIDQSFGLLTKFLPENAIVENITWESSNEDIVYVDDYGYVYLLSEGSATVTATTENGLTDSVTITVPEGGHTYENACDEYCDYCGAYRPAEHTWGEYVSNEDATPWYDGTKTSVCEVCGAEDTITDEGSQLPPQTSGSCGDNVDWEYDADTATLYISGSGKMYNYTWTDYTPWYSYLSDIQKVEIAEGVANIGGGAFKNCLAVTEVSIPETVTDICYNAFQNCSSLGNVTLPTSVKSIQSGAFADCGNIEEVHTDSVEGWLDIDFGSAFSNPLANKAFLVVDEDIVIPDGTEEIKDYAFTGCQNLYEIEIPDSVKRIGTSAFDGCDSLADVNIPGGVTEIVYGTFNNCASLLSIDIPDSVKSIDENAFSDCISLSEVKLGKGIKEIGGEAFANAYSLKSIALPDSVTYIGMDAFNNCGMLESITLPENDITIGRNAFADTAYYCNEENWSGSVLYIGKHLIKASEDLSGGYAVTAGTLTIADYAFECCYDLTSVDISDGVVRIGYGAFEQCENMEYVGISDTVKTIDPYAFAHCLCLEEIYIGSGIERIGKYAFYDCYPSRVFIDDIAAWCGVEFFDYYECSSPFYGGAALYVDGEIVTELVIPEDVTSIGDYTFKGCSSITSLVIPEGVRSIGAFAFEYCDNIQTVTVPASLKEVRNDAFYGCDLVESVFITDLEAWCDIAFGWYANPLVSRADLYLDGELVTELVIPESVKKIKDYAFRGCTSIESVILHDGVKEIGQNAFGNCKYLEKAELGKVELIGDNALANCENLTDVIFPESLETIGAYAFGSCGLTSVTIPDSVREIGREAFYSCESLDAITIPDSVRFIGSDIVGDTAYSYNEDNWENDALYIGNHLINLESDIKGEYEIKEGTVTIAGGSFQYNPGLTAITIPEGVKSIGEYAFSGCYGITEVDIPSSVEIIGDGAFESCYDLQSVTIGDGVKEIGSHAFAWCENLSTIDVPDSVVKIGGRAFYNTKIMDNEDYWQDGMMYLGKHLIAVAGDVEGEFEVKTGTISISDGAFEYNENITSVVIPDSVTSIGNLVFSGCTALEAVEIPDSVTEIGAGAFSNCSSLTKLDIPETVTKLGNHAFAGCTALTDIVIPKTVTAIGYFTFINCEALQSVTLPKTVESIGMSAFESCDSLETVNYGGDENDRENIFIDSYNEPLENATWIYTEGHKHVWSEYVYNNDATSTADGTKTRTCADCGESETVTAEGTMAQPGYTSDSRLPHMVLNANGNGVGIDMRGSWATRVYWGYIGDEEIPYTWFDDFRLGCGTDYNADFAPRADKAYYFTKAGYYRFVLRCIVKGSSIDDYEYKDMVYTFYYDGTAKVAVPSLTVIDRNTVQIEKNGLAVTKLYYGNIGTENVPYGWFNDFWGKALATKSYKVDFSVTWGEQYKLATKGFYNFVIVYKDTEGVSHEIVYTVEAKENIGIITAENGVATLNVDSVGGTVNKLYWGYIGDDATGVVDYNSLKAAAGTLTGDWTVKTGRTYTLDKTGYYGFCVNYTTESYISGGYTNVNYDIIYIVENK